VAHRFAVNVIEVNCNGRTVVQSVDPEIVDALQNLIALGKDRLLLGDRVLDW
jgi:hypothetical protein